MTNETPVLAIPPQTTSSAAGGSPPMPSEAALIRASEEAFAGMRAYHQSEIEHKRDTVHIFTTILAANAGLIAAVFGAMEFAERIPAGISVVLFAVPPLVTVLTTLLVLSATLTKIATDASRYQEFKRQSITANSLLGLYLPVTSSQGVESVMPAVRPSKGAPLTAQILTTFCSAIILLSLAGWGMAMAAWALAANAPASAPSSGDVPPPSNSAPSSHPTSLQ